MPAARAPRLSLAPLLLGALSACACQTARPMLAQPRGPPTAQATLFEEVFVFDGLADARAGPLDVLVVGDRIAALAPHGSLQDARAARAARIDGRGRTLLPGLIDCHVHLGGGDGLPPWAAKRPNLDAQSAALVYSGVTTILAAARDADYRDLEARIALGELAGPRIIASSRFFTAPGGHPVPFLKALLPWPLSSLILRGRVVELEDEAAIPGALDGEIKDGSPAFIKIVYDDIPPGAPRLSKGLLGSLIAAVRARGLRASVHVGSPEEALDAVQAGAALLMHVPGDEELAAAQVQALAASGIPIVTTNRIYTVLDAANRGTLAFSPLEREVMPPGAAEAFAQKPAGYETPGFPQDYIASLPARAGHLAVNTRLLFDAGARLVAGTDSGLPAIFHGAALHRELAALAALGIPPARVLRMATSDAARALDPKADYGVIAVGARADLLLVEGDPLEDLRATEQIVGVWQAGARVERGEAHARP